MKTLSWNAITVEPMTDYITRQMWNGEHTTVARIVLKKGAVVPRHTHPSEQFSLVLEGALEFTFDGGKQLVRTGEMIYIPPHVPHQAVALEDTLDLDVFGPRREDWISGDDKYLRSGNQGQPGSGSR
jgi:quercetin dioxygenase-like cupin family protein